MGEVAPTVGELAPTPDTYRRAREAARAALEEEPELINPGYLVLRRVADAVVDVAWAEALSADGNGARHD